MPFTPFPNFLIVLIIIPVFVTISFLSKKTFNLVGLYYSDVEIKYKTGHSARGVIVLKTDNEIYFKDSISSMSTMLLSKGDIESINILYKKEKVKEDTASNSKTPTVEEDSLNKSNNLKLVQDSTTTTQKK